MKILFYIMSLFFASSVFASKPNNVKIVDLGLSVNWSSHNVSATTSPIGGYFAWGETHQKSTYSQATYKNENKDVATEDFGTDWRIPTKNELQELIDKCTWTLTIQDNVEGYIIKGPNGNSIFLPFGGRYNQNGLTATSKGVYWSSNKEGTEAYVLDISSSKKKIDTEDIYDGCTVRPVTKLPASDTDGIVEIKDPGSKNTIKKSLINNRLVIIKRTTSFGVDGKQIK